MTDRIDATDTGTAEKRNSPTTINSYRHNDEIDTSERNGTQVKSTGSWPRGLCYSVDSDLSKQQTEQISH